MRTVLSVLEVIVLLFGLIGILHVVSARSNRPFVLMARVEGKSMQPTLEPGDRILCVRAPWHQGDIVVADVAQEELVIKRVDGQRAQQVRLVGDNREHSATYWVYPKDIKSIMLCRLLLPSLHSVSAEAQGTGYSSPDLSQAR